jgi:SAM-dependent methyltransferase
LNPQLDNVDWILGDGTSLAGIDDCSADACTSHVVFQHIPDPEITLGYIREIGRVLRPGGWAAFEVSAAPDIHRPPSPARRAGVIARALLRRGPKGQAHPAWLGSSVEIADLRDAAGDGGTEVENIVGQDTQFCSVLLRKVDHPTP